MRHARFLALAVLILGWTVTSAHASALLVVSGGILTGAKGVDVGGTLYDVTFVDGTCVAFFDGCDSVADFAFTSQGDADAASAALLADVFVDGPAGQFDSFPDLTFGCSAELACTASTPFALSPFGGGFLYSGAFHFKPPLTSLVSPGEFDFQPDFSGAPDQMLARWTPAEIDASPVPEPASLTLLGLGLAGMGARRWRQREA